MAIGPPEKMLLLRMPHMPVSLICCSSLCSRTPWVSRAAGDARGCQAVCGSGAVCRCENPKTLNPEADKMLLLRMSMCPAA